MAAQPRRNDRDTAAVPDAPARSVLQALVGPPLGALLGDFIVPRLVRETQRASSEGGSPHLSGRLIVGDARYDVTASTTAPEVRVARGASAVTLALVASSSAFPTMRITTSSGQSATLDVLALRGSTSTLIQEPRPGLERWSGNGIPTAWFEVDPRGRHGDREGAEAGPVGSASAVPPVGLSAAGGPLGSAGAVTPAGLSAPLESAGPVTPAGLSAPLGSAGALPPTGLSARGAAALATAGDPPAGSAAALATAGDVRKRPTADTLGLAPLPPSPLPNDGPPDTEGWRITNEVAQKFPRWSVRGGAYLGVGASQNYDHLTTARSEVAFLVDADPYVVSDHRGVLALVGQAPTPQQFLSRIAGVRLEGDEATMPAERLIPRLRNRAADPAYVEETLAAVPERERPDVQRALAVGRRFLLPTWQRQMREGQNRWLTADDPYQHLRFLRNSGRIYVLHGDISGSDTIAAVGREVTRLDSVNPSPLQFRAIYLSNAEQWLGNRSEKKQGFPGWGKNLGSLPLDPHGVLLRTVNDTEGKGAYNWFYQSATLHDYAQAMKSLGAEPNYEALNAALQPALARQKAVEHDLSFVAATVAPPPAVTPLAPPPPAAPPAKPGLAAIGPQVADVATVRARVEAAVVTHVNGRYDDQKSPILRETFTQWSTQLNDPKARAFATSVSSMLNACHFTSSITGVGMRALDALERGEYLASTQLAGVMKDMLDATVDDTDASKQFHPDGHPVQTTGLAAVQAESSGDGRKWLDLAATLAPKQYFASSRRATVRLALQAAADSVPFNGQTVGARLRDMLDAALDKNDTAGTWHPDSFQVASTALDHCRARLDGHARAWLDLYSTVSNSLFYASSKRQVLRPFLDAVADGRPLAERSLAGVLAAALEACSDARDAQNNWRVDSHTLIESAMPQLAQQVTSERGKQVLALVNSARQGRYSTTGRAIVGIGLDAIHLDDATTPLRDVAEAIIATGNAGERADLRKVASALALEPPAPSPASAVPLPTPALAAAPAPLSMSPAQLRAVAAVSRASEGLPPTLDVTRLPFGVEIEAEKFNRTPAARAIEALPAWTENEAVPRWQVVDDASLASGGEAVSPVMVTSGGEAARQIGEVTRALTASGATIGDRCGLHVHVDASRLGARGLSALMRMALQHEQLLFTLAQNGRPLHRGLIENAGKRLDVPHFFAKPFSRALDDPFPLTHADSANEFRNALYQAVPLSSDPHHPVAGPELPAVDSTEPFHPDRQDPARYFAINFNSFWYRGTIEFRLFNASLDPTDIMDDVTLALGMVKAAAEGRDDFLEASPLQAGVTSPEISRANFESLMQIIDAPADMRARLQRRIEAAGARLVDDAPITDPRVLDVALLQAWGERFESRGRQLHSPLEIARTVEGDLRGQVAALARVSPSEKAAVAACVNALSQRGFQFAQTVGGKPAVPLTDDSRIAASLQRGGLAVVAPDASVHTIGQLEELQHFTRVECDPDRLPAVEREWLAAARDAADRLRVDGRRVEARNTALRALSKGTATVVDRQGVGRVTDSTEALRRWDAVARGDGPSVLPQRQAVLLERLEAMLDQGWHLEIDGARIEPHTFASFDLIASTDWPKQVTLTPPEDLPEDSPPIQGDSARATPLPGTVAARPTAAAISVAQAATLQALIHTVSGDEASLPAATRLCGPRMAQLDRLGFETTPPLSPLALLAALDAPQGITISDPSGHAWPLQGADSFVALADAQLATVRGLTPDQSALLARLRDLLADRWQATVIGTDASRPLVKEGAVAWALCNGLKIHLQHRDEQAAAGPTRDLGTTVADWASLQRFADNEAPTEAGRTTPHATLQWLQSAGVELAYANTEKRVPIRGVTTLLDRLEGEGVRVTTPGRIWWKHWPRREFTIHGQADLNRLQQRIAGGPTP